jgi:hypothetical protein
MNSAQIGAIAASISVPIVMVLLAKAFPAKVLDPASAKSDLAALTPKYRKWEIAFSVCYIVAWIPCTLLIWVVFLGLARWHSSLLSDADFKLTTDPVFYLLPAFFLTLIVSVKPIVWIAKSVLQSRYLEYETYTCLKTKFDSSRVGPLLNWGVGTACGIAVFIALNWYVLIRQDALIIHGALAVQEDRYSYADVRTIRTAPALIAPNGNTVYRREFVATFANGRILSTSTLLSELTESRKRALMQLISARSNIPIQEIAVFQRSEL